MQHVAIITSGMVGITNASFKLVYKLKTEGHKVSYLCPIDIKEKVEKHGIDYIQLPPIHYNFSFLKPKGYVYHLSHLKSQYSNGIKALNFLEYEKILSDLNPDVVLVDEELHELIFTSIKLNIPVKLLSQFFSGRMRFNLPPIRTDIIPKKGLRGSTMGILKAWLFLKTKIFGRLILNKMTLRATMAETGDINFIKKVIDAVKQEKSWKIIISLGGKLEPNTFKNVPNNVHIFKWVPQLYILSKIDCSINHGGIHTIHECIHNKVPMLIYSGKKFDQNGNAARIDFHGLGLMGDKDLDSSERINAKIKMILSKPSYAHNMESAHQIYKRYDAKEISSNL